MTETTSTHQRWGFDAKSASGYTKSIGLFEKPNGDWQIRVRPALASSEIVIDLTNEAARGLRYALCECGIGPD